jgi:DNA-binding IclR family transcriptional regulator
MARNPKEGRKITSVSRALSIIELFDYDTIELGITEISNRLDLHKSTVSGLVNTLYASGYLDQNPSTRKYFLGMKIVEKAFVVLDNFDIVKTARTHMKRLRIWRDETVNLAILDDDEVLYIDRELGTRTLGMQSHVGKREKAHSTALGKALLSQLDEDELGEYLSKYSLDPITPNTITRPKKLRQELTNFRHQGYAVDMEENEIGGVCIAAPIVDLQGNTLAAISISLPIARLETSEIPLLGKKLIETATAISEDIGYVSNWINKR